MLRIKKSLVAGIVGLLILGAVAVSQSRRSIDDSSGLSSDSVAMIYLDTRSQIIRSFTNPRICPLDEEELVLLSSLEKNSDIPRLASIAELGSFVVPNAQMANPMFVNGSSEYEAPIYLNSLLAPEIGLAKSLADILAFEASRFHKLSFSSWQKLSDSLSNCWRPKIQSYQYGFSAPSGGSLHSVQFDADQSLSLYVDYREETRNVTQKFLDHIACDNGVSPVKITSLKYVSFDDVTNRNEVSGQLLAELDCGLADLQQVETHFLIKSFDNVKTSDSWRIYFTR